MCENKLLMFQECSRTPNLHQVITGYYFSCCSLIICKPYVKIVSRILHQFIKTVFSKQSVLHEWNELKALDLMLTVKWGLGIHLCWSQDLTGYEGFDRTRFLVCFSVMLENLCFYRWSCTGWLSRCPPLLDVLHLKRTSKVTPRGLLSSVSCRDCVGSGGGAGDNLAKLSSIEYDCVDKGFALCIIHFVPVHFR